MNCCRQLEKKGHSGPFLKLARISDADPALDELGVTCYVFTFQVVEQFTTLRNHAQQTTTAVVIFCALQSGPAGG